MSLSLIPADLPLSLSLSLIPLSTLKAETLKAVPLGDSPRLGRAQRPWRAISLEGRGH
jgi:hypothetical protein